MIASSPPSKMSARSMYGSSIGGWRLAPRAASASIPATWPAYTAWAWTTAWSAPAGSLNLARAGPVTSGVLPSSLSGVHPYILRRRDRIFLSRAGAFPPRAPPTMQSSTNLLFRPAAQILDITWAPSGTSTHPVPARLPPPPRATARRAPPRAARGWPTRSPSARTSVSAASACPFFPPARAASCRVRFSP